MAGTSTVTVTCSLQSGNTLNYNVSDQLDSYQPSISTVTNLKMTPGGGVNQINQASSRLFVIPASGTDTVNLYTGLITGSETSAMTYPATSGSNTIALTRLTYMEVDLWAGGASATVMTAAGVNGFTNGPLGSGSITMKGSDSTGVGGDYRFQRSDSLGWGVSSINCNVVLANLDTANGSTFTLTVAG